MTWTRAPDGAVVVALGGRWSIHAPCPALDAVARAVAAPGVSQVRFDCAALAAWDSSLLGAVAQLAAEADRRGATVDRAGLPLGAQRLLDSAARAPQAAPPPTRPPLGVLARIGLFATRGGDEVHAGLAFIGDVTVALGRTALGRAHVRGRDVVAQIQRAGVEGLPIVALVAFLIGIVLAFVGSLQLQRFGAAPYVADLVGLGMVREVGALITAIVVAGRTGAAYAAELATMKVTQEIDALEVVGLPPAELLVVPRIVALASMVPLLAVYASAVGIVGGALIGVFALGVAPLDYVHRTTAIIDPSDLAIGLVKALTYGVMIALAGCAAGLRATAGAAAVGEAATRAVVTGIVFVTIACGGFAMLAARLGI